MHCARGRGGEPREETAQETPQKRQHNTVPVPGRALPDTSRSPPKSKGSAARHHATPQCSPPLLTCGVRAAAALCWSGCDAPQGSRQYVATIKGGEAGRKEAAARGGGKASTRPVAKAEGGQWQTGQGSACTYKERAPQSKGVEAIEEGIYLAQPACRHLPMPSPRRRRGRRAFALLLLMLMPTWAAFDWDGDGIFFLSAALRMRRAPYRPAAANHLGLGRGGRHMRRAGEAHGAMEPPPPAFNCKELKTRHGRIASENTFQIKSIQCKYAMRTLLRACIATQQRNRPTSCRWVFFFSFFYRCGLQVVCVVCARAGARFSARQKHRMHVTTRHTR